MVEDITISEAVRLDKALWVDVRSENEYAEATIPGAVNLPVLNNEERALVGASYRGDGPAASRRLALQLAAPKLPAMIAELDGLAGEKNLVVFCWRGGERSRFMASILDTMGYRVYRVIGGYKSYRRHVKEFFDQETLIQRAVVLHGLTGVGKTDVLSRLERKGLPVLNLEELARHRGSVFGKIGLPPSPSQKSFESAIMRFLTSNDKGVFFVECESRRIGNLLVPPPVMKAIGNGIRILLYAPLAVRVKRIREIYAGGPGDNVRQLQEATSSLARRIGRAKVEELNRLLEERNFEPVFSFLLKNYYDPLYKYPQGPCAEYSFCVDATDIEKASEIIFNFATNLSEYKLAGYGVKAKN